jgi:hypothetical protein
MSIIDIATIFVKEIAPPESNITPRQTAPGKAREKWGIIKANRGPT